MDSNISLNQQFFADRDSDKGIVYITISSVGTDVKYVFKVEEISAKIISYSDRN